MDTHWKSDNIAIITIVTEPNSLLASSMGKELRYPIISIIWGYVCRLEIERYIYDKKRGKEPSFFPLPLPGRAFPFMPWEGGESSRALIPKEGNGGFKPWLIRWKYRPPWKILNQWVFFDPCTLSIIVDTIQKL